MKNFCATICLFFLALNCYAQEFQIPNSDQKIIDSLKTILANANSDSLKCITNFKLSLIYGKNDNQSLLKKHLKIANAKINESEYLKDIASYYNTINTDLTEATIKKLQYTNNRLKKYNNSEVYSVRTKILSNIGLFYQRQNKTLEAIKIFTTQAIPLAKKAKNYQELAFLYKLIALVFYNNDDIAQASNYLELSIKTLEENPVKSVGYEKDVIETYLFFIEVLAVQKKIKEAELYLLKSRELLKNNKNPNILIEYYFAKGAVLHEKGEYDNEDKIYNKGIVLAKSSNDSYAEVRFNLLKFDALKLQKKLEEAKLLLIETLNNKHLNIEDKVAYSKELALLYKELNDYPNALKHYEIFIVLNDSLNNISYKNEIADLEAKFKNKENSSKISQLKIQKDSAELKAQNNWLKYSIFGIATIVLVIVLLFILLYQRKKNQLSKEKYLQNKQEIKILKSQKELEVIQAMVDGEEVERKRIARDLHDGVGSKLSALKIRLTRLDTKGSNQEEVEQINELLNSSISELRQVSYNLVPEALLTLGLNNALSDFCHLMHSEQVKIEFQSFGIHEDIPVSTQINIYRIVQELVNNALKHSNCSEILVSCTQNETTFFVAVEDNGKGFDMVTQSNSGFGLKNIQSRVATLNGTLQIDSGTSGTVFNIELNVTT